MYLKHFKLKEFPFGLVSDPRYLYLSEDHARVKAFMEYAMRVQDSFVVCTGEIGTGKTTLVNDALAQENPNAVIASIQTISYKDNEFIQSILLKFNIQPYNLTRLQLFEQIRMFLLQQHRASKKVFLIVDEAHKLSEDLLEDIRYLSDLEHESNKLLGVILVGQPELNSLLDQPNMEHIVQRIRLRCHIKPLIPEEISEYIKHRLSIAGAANNAIFDDSCVATIHQFTGGRMRLINILCDYALLHCSVEKIKIVDNWVIQKSANELQWEAFDKRFGEQSDVTRVLVKPAENTKAKLIIKCKSKVINELQLDKACITIGRQSDNDIPVDDYRVSRYHAQILVQGKDVYLHDLNSTNGTFIERSKIQVHQLHHGDNFLIGHYEFMFLQSIPKVHSLPVENPDVTRQLTLQNQDKTRIRPVQAVVSLVKNSKINNAIVNKPEVG